MFKPTLFWVIARSRLLSPPGQAEAVAHREIGVAGSVAVFNARRFDSCKVRPPDLASWCLEPASWITRPSCRVNLVQSSGGRLCTQCFAKTLGYTCGVSTHFMLRTGARGQRHKSSVVRGENMDGGGGNQIDTLDDWRLAPRLHATRQRCLRNVARSRESRVCMLCSSNSCVTTLGLQATPLRTGAWSSILCFSTSLSWQHHAAFRSTMLRALFRGSME